MIDKTYFQSNPVIYYRDFLLALAAFVIGFVWCMHAEGPVIVIPWVMAVVGIHRGGIFMHELCHRPKDPKLKLFSLLWHGTVGAVIQLPRGRFKPPHDTHHANGTFRTAKDPQYLLVRSNPGLMAILLVVMPFVMPLLTLLQIFTASLGGLFIEEAIERAAQKKGHSLTTFLEGEGKVNVIQASRYTLVCLIAYAILLPETIPLYYSILVGAWFLTVARIPLEHELEYHAEGSGPRDQVIDSFTVETPLAVLCQPIGFRYHTAHHMYPGVPYHNLPALNEELKRTNPEYRQSVISLWAAIRGPRHPNRRPEGQGVDGAAPDTTAEGTEAIAS
jgi:fatty acid desaturase